MQELAEDGGHHMPPSEQCDGGLEQLCPGQAAMAALGLSVARSSPIHWAPAWHIPALKPVASRPSQGFAITPMCGPPATAARVSFLEPTPDHVPPCSDHLWLPTKSMARPKGPCTNWPQEPHPVPPTHLHSTFQAFVQPGPLPGSPQLAHSQGAPSQSLNLCRLGLGVPHRLPVPQCQGVTACP